MGKNIVAEKSFDFAVRIVNLYRYLCEEKREFTLSKQILRSGTSIGANIRESLQAYSKKDFLHSINIALKEAYETQYWIELLYATKYTNYNLKDSILNDCNELVNLLVATVKTTKRNLEKESKK